MAVDFEESANEYVNCGSASVLDNIRYLALCCWIKLESFDQDPYHHSFFDKGQWHWQCTENGALTFGSNSTSYGWTSCYTGNGVISTGTWYWIYWQRDRENAGACANHACYVNNSSESLSGGGLYNTISDAGNDLRLGYSSNDSCLDGLVEDMRLFSNYLTSDERAQVYNGGLGWTHPIGDEVGWWQMSHATNVPQNDWIGKSLAATNTIPDDSANSNTGTPGNTPTGAANHLTWFKGPGRGMIVGSKIKEMQKFYQELKRGRLSPDVLRKHYGELLTI